MLSEIECSVDQGSEVRTWSVDCFKEYLEEYDKFAHHLSYINAEDL